MGKSIMTSEELNKLWLTLGSIEEHCANTTRHMENVDRLIAELDKKVNNIREERAEERGAARWSGGISGGVISTMIMGIKALWEA
jgi:hypothetical protein